MAPSSHRRRKSSLNSKSRSNPPGTTSSSRRPPRRLVPFLRLVWVATVLWTEIGTFQSSVSRCSWPDVPAGAGRVKVLVLADPQLPSMSYTYQDRGWLARWFSLKIIEQFLRKAWRVTVRTRKPDAVVFLGDLLDGGVEAIDRRDYASYVHRFHRTFPGPSRRPLSPSPHHLLHLPGNHDLGLQPDTSPSHSSLARERFAHTWEPGRLSGEKSWGNVSVVWVDAVGLVEERKAGLGPGEATNFVRLLGGSKSPSTPRILFTHIPLYRPEGTSCGPLRESPRTLRQGAGLNYQNEVDEELSRFVLDNIEPDLIFSGDDHDYCVVQHRAPKAGSPAATEVTVKSFSMAMGVRNPGYLLLSLPFLPSSAPSTFHPPLPSYASCLLPSQLHLYLLIYLPLFLLTLALLFGSRLWRAYTTPRRVHARQNGLPIHGHRKSLSRSLFLGPPGNGRAGGATMDGDGSDEDEGMFSDYGNYAAVSPTPMRLTASLPSYAHHGRHASHPSMDGSISLGRAAAATMFMEDLEEGMVTPVGVGGASAFGEPARPPRRISRMFWEDPSGPSLRRSGRSPHPHSTSSGRPSLIGLLYWFASAIQAVLRRLAGQNAARTAGRIGGKVEAVAEKVGKNPLVRGGVKDVGRAVWWAAALYVVIWICFWW